MGCCAIFANGAGGITCLFDGMSSARASNIMAERAPAPCHNVCEERAKCRPASTYSLPRAMPTPTPENSAARTKGWRVCCMMSVEPKINIPALATPARKRMMKTRRNGGSHAIASINNPVARAEANKNGRRREGK